MKSVREIGDIANVPVLVRAALNVPIENGAVANDYRLRKALPTIEYLTGKGARVILISHIGEGGTETLAPVEKAFERLLPKISFCEQTLGPTVVTAIEGMAPGSVLVLENLRRDPREVGNDPGFAAELAALGHIFVEDSFDTCHRLHASIVTLPTLLPAYAGLLVEEEVAALSQALRPSHPALAVIGGAKFETKEPVLSALLASYDKVFVGGALANDFLKAKGCEIGASATSDADPEKLGALLANDKLVLPEDLRVVPTNALGALDANQHVRVAAISDVHADEVIVDAGPAASARLASLVSASPAILWNGPLGKYEGEFVDATDALARAVASAGAHSVVGGGDTVASIERLGLMSHFSFVSTGGGAMLDFLAYGTLPGLEALESGGL